jgi:hypothetical protein
MRTIAIDALDAVELAEIPRVLHERLDSSSNGAPPRIDDLRADMARLINRLPYEPNNSLTNVGASICPERASTERCPITIDVPTIYVLWPPTLTMSPDPRDVAADGTSWRNHG